MSINPNYGRAVRRLFCVFSLASGCCFGGGGDEALPLAGQWRFALDRDDAGIREQWFSRELPDRIQLPGVLQSQGFGDEISTNTPWVLSLYDKNWFLREDYTNYAQPGNVKVPFLCQPPRHYLGAAWYQRDIEIPTNWAGKRVVLFLERPRWESRVWLDDKLIGTSDSLCVPHEYELGVNLAPSKHTLTVRMDNRLLLPYRPDAHSVSDSLAQSWNGIVGDMKLRADDAVWIEHVQLNPDPARGGVEAKIFIRNTAGQAVPARLVFVQVTPKNFGGNAYKPLQQTATLDAGQTNLTIFFPMGDQFETWSEFNPKFYTLRATIAGPGFRSNWDGTFGMRDFRTDGTDFVINGRPTFLRGTHHGGDFPLTGYPPTDVEYWRKVFRTCKDWGLNHVRFHSYCPPEAAFVAADEIGIYLAIEPGMWNTFNPDSPMEDMLYRETERILKAYGNHPSFVMIAASNEPKGRWKDVLPKWAEHFRAIDPRHLYTTGTGFTDADAPGPLDKVDYTATQRFSSRQVRGASGWFGGDYSRSLQGVNVPVVTHENGQWCAYPDFDVIKKFTGYMRPGNYEIFRDSAVANGVLEMNKEYALASGRFQLECYKEEVEASLRTPGIAGFQLLDLHDYVGQGTALVGLLDPFWESKGYVKANEWRQFCSRTVPLVRLTKRQFTTDEILEAPVDVTHYGFAPLTDTVTTWHVRNTLNEVVTNGHFATGTIHIGKNPGLGKVKINLSKLPAPVSYRLIVESGPLLTGGIRPSHNSWNFWVYPPADKAMPVSDVLITSSWDDATAKLSAGGKVLFLPHKADLNWNSPPLDTVPVFWNRLMNPGWARMLGLWCDTSHPALAAFPTDANCDWQWTQILRGVRAINLSKLPRELRPIVAAIDDWNRNWKLGVLFEARVGAGRLLVSAIDIERNTNAVARQLRRSLLEYMAGEKFQPRTEISPEQFNSLHFDSRIMKKLSATAQAAGAGAEAAIDGDPNTYWLVGTAGRGRDAAPPIARPHTLTVSFTNTVAMDGLVLMNRQNDRDRIGDVRQFEIHSSNDGTNWTPVVSGELPSTWNPQTVRFEKTISTRQIRFVSLSGYGNDTASALAELAVIYAGPKLSDVDDGDIEYRRSRSTSSDVDEGATP